MSEQTIRVAEQIIESAWSRMIEAGMQGGVSLGVQEKAMFIAGASEAINIMGSMLADMRHASDRILKQIERDTR